MSNLLKAITFLKTNSDNRFLKVTDENGNVVGIEKTFLKDIPDENLEAYLKLHLGTLEQDLMLWIEAREIAGATDKKRGSFPVKIEAEKKPVQMSEPAPVQQENHQQQQPQFLGTAVQRNDGTLGMSVSDVMMLQLKAARLEDITEKLTETRKELVEIKHKHNLLDIDARDLKAKLATAEAEKNLAIRLAKTENKSFFESPAFEKMMEKAPEMLGNFAALKSGNAPAFSTESLGAASNLSETKQGFVDYLSENLTDEQVNYLGSICHYLPNEAFKNELKTLIVKQNGN